MLYGTLVSMNLHSGGGFDKLSPNGGELSPNGVVVGGFLGRLLTRPFGPSSPPFGLSSPPFGPSSPSFGPSSPSFGPSPPPFGLSSPPFGLSLSKPSRGPTQP